MRLEIAIGDISDLNTRVNTTMRSQSIFIPITTLQFALSADELYDMSGERNASL